MRNLLFFITFLTICTTNAQNYDYGTNISLEDYNFVLGTNSFPTKYQFSKDAKLVEQAKQTRVLGSNIFKTSITERSLKDYGYKLSDANTIMDVMKLIPDYDKVFEMDFKYYFFWLHTATGIKWKKGISKKQEKALYNEMFDFASYLLKKYL